MRLDKYLKLSRLIKRRTVAKDAALNERIYVNNKLSKPSTIVKIGDTLTLHLGLRIVTVKISSLEVVKDGLMYELLNDEKQSIWLLF